VKIRRKRVQANVSSAATGDIAFLLIIFFLILARVQDDSHLQWIPAQGTDIEQVKNARASVVIDVDNNTYLNGGQIGVGQLADELEKVIDVDPNRAVLFKVHREATAIYYEPAIEAISEAGGTVYHILEKE